MGKMAKEVGFLYCAACESIATVLECGGQKVGNFYTSCICGKTQGGGLKRQQFIKNNMVISIEKCKMNLEKTVIENTLEIQNNQDLVIENPLEVQNNPESVTDNKISKLRMDIEIEEPFEKPFSTGFWAMCCGLSAAAGLLIGHSVGVRRG